MTYDGTMVLPSNYVAVDQNEMEYVEGGGVNRSTFANGVDIGIAALSLVYGVVTAFSALHTMGRIAGGLTRNIMTKSATTALKAMIKGAAKAFAISVTSSVLGFIDVLAGIIFNFSIGNLVARIVDFADGNYNGICFG